MTTRYGVNRESFEALLADAFAVQQSGLDRASLGTLVEIQKFIASEHSDLKEGMQMIAHRAFTLSSADGVALALLDGNRLVYVAGEGSAAKDVGRHIAAVLKVSLAQDTRQEILRVENAETDPRIEAAICRQFDASSLLMLPICQDHVLIGVLQVLFRRPHRFVDDEIRVLRLMVDVLEEGILPRKQRGERQETLGPVQQIHDAQPGNVERALEVVVGTLGTLRTEESTCASTIEPPVLQGHGLAAGGRQVARVLSKQSQAFREIGTRRRPHLWASLRTSLEATINARWSADFWYLSAALSALLALGTVVCLGNVSHLFASIAGFSMLRGKGQATVTQPLSANQETNPHGRGLREHTRSGAALERIKVSPHEVDYIAEDVTIRRFTTPSEKPQTRNDVKEVNFGDDVTVRYFATATIVFHPPSREGVLDRKTSASVTK